MKVWAVLLVMCAALSGCGGGGSGNGSQNPSPGPAAPTAAVTPANGTEIGTSAVIRIVFSRSMNPSTLVLGGNLATQLDGEWSATSTVNDTFTITPIDEWTPPLTLTVDAKDTDDVPLARHTLAYTADTVAPALTIASLRDKGVVHSGFLTGTASDTSGIAAVEVSLDGDEYQPAMGTATWKFQLPAGANTWRDNSLHTVTVRATDNAGVDTTSATLNVRKGNNQDVNGDGYADVVVAGGGTGSRRVYVFHSAGTAGVATIAAAAANTKITGDQVTLGDDSWDTWFGIALATADVNGDGYADVIVGAPNYNPNPAGNQFSTGRVYVFHSAGDTGVTATVAADAETIVTGEAAGNFFSEAVVAGDLNGDGYADLIVGAGSYSNDTGRAYVFHSAGDAGVTAAAPGDADTTLTGEGDHDFFGQFLAMGDVNGDSIADVVAAAAGFGGVPGRVYVFHGVDSGIAVTAAADADTLLTGDAGAWFNGRLAVGDVNGDGFADVVGSGNATSGTGRAYVFHAANDGSGVPSAFAANADSIIAGQANPNNVTFASALGVGDVNGDGFADVLVEDWQWNTNRGRLVTFHGSATGVAATTAGAANATLSGTENTDEFGRSFGLRDVNGDGRMDVVAGMVGFDGVTGAVYLFHSTAAGAPTKTAATANREIQGEGQGVVTRFGNTVAP